MFSPHHLLNEAFALIDNYFQGEFFGFALRETQKACQMSKCQLVTKFLLFAQLLLLLPWLLLLEVIQTSGRGHWRRARATRRAVSKAHKRGQLKLINSLHASLEYMYIYIYIYHINQITVKYVQNMNHTHAHTLAHQSVCLCFCSVGKWQLEFFFHLTFDLQIGSKSIDNLKGS